MNQYDPAALEPKWQKIWADTNLYAAIDGDQSRAKYYMLTEFPYPSAAGLHAGHIREYTIGDVVARHRRMQGYNVLYPMGYDAFGLPTENYAIKNKVRPQDATARNVAIFRQQLEAMGYSFDWDREVNTSDPSYYRWTQWLFLQFYKAGLAYQAEIPIWWCPKEKTGLANEEVVNGVHERCGTPVEKKLLKQWMLKITAYADRLIEGLKTVDYPARIADQQVNWIGRSEGAEIDFKVGKTTITVYTTRPDTLAGATFLVLAPEHSAVTHITSPNRRAEVEKYLKEAGRETDLTRQEENRPKTGVFTGAYAKNPITQADMPIWVADYVLAGYGTGAIMAVPAHDERDYAFARAMNKQLGYGRQPMFPDTITPPNASLPFENREAALAIVKHPTEATYLMEELKAWETPLHTFPMGGIDPGESPVEAALRELGEETGYDHVSRAYSFGPDYVTEFYHEYKKVNRRAHIHPVIVELSDLHQGQVSGGERKLHTLHWLSAAEVLKKQHGDGAKTTFRNYMDETFVPPIQIIPVVEPVVGIPQKNEHEKEAIIAVVRDPNTRRVLMLDWGPRQTNWGGRMFVGGGVEPGESDLVAAAKREIAEETGYAQVEFVRASSARVHNHYFSNVKRRNDLAHITPILFELRSDKQESISLDEGEKNKFKLAWVDEADVLGAVDDEGHALAYRLLYDEACYTGDGVVINSNRFDGLSTAEAKRAVTSWLVDEGLGRKATKYRLRDWIFSRQHYWGEPIPIIHCPSCGVVPVPDDQLPVILPPVEHYEPTDTGESPLASVKDWVNTKCPVCKGPARRETDTMPNWAGSSWYYLRFMDPHNDKMFAAPDRMDYWGMVDLYLGGMEHTTLHLLYSRFWHQFLHELNLVPAPEPYAARRGQGIVLASDGRKMSKSLGNVVNPTDIIARYGADALRLYVLFMAPYDESTPWSDERLNGVSRFLYRVWHVAQELSGQAFITPESVGYENSLGAFETEVDRMTHKTLKKVHDALADMRFNTVVSSLMEFVNFLASSHNRRRLQQEDALALRARTMRALILMLAPLAPHITEELWHQLGAEGSVHTAAWPAYDPTLIHDDILTVVVQVNGRVRAQLALPSGVSEDEQADAARADPNIERHLRGKTVVKTVVIPRKLVNFVVK